MLDLMMPAAFENGHEARDVRVDVGKWIFDRISNTGLSGEVDDPIECVLLKEIGDSVAVFALHSDHLKAIPNLKALCASFFEFRIVVVVEIIETDDLFATIKKSVCGRRPDESSGTCEEYRHGWILSEHFLECLDHSVLLFAGEA